MRMRFEFALVLALAGCGGASDDTAGGEAAAANGQAEAAATGDPANASENPFEQAGNAQQPAATSCPEEPGLSCAGALQIRAVNASLADDRNGYVVRGSLRFQNARSEPIRFALVQTNPNLRLSNGAQIVFAAHYAFPGRAFCSDRETAGDCYTRNADAFTELAPGDSPVEVNFQLGTRGVESGLVPTMPDVTSGTMNFSIVTVEAGGERRRRDISLNNIPIETRIGS